MPLGPVDYVVPGLRAATFRSMATLNRLFELNDRPPKNAAEAEAAHNEIAAAMEVQRARVDELLAELRAMKEG